MRIEATVDVDVPIEHAFRCATEHVPEWSETVVSERIVEQTAGGIGTRFIAVCRERENGPHTEFHGEVLQHDPPRHSTVTLRGPHFDLEVRYDFVELAPDRTRVTQRTIVRARSFAGRVAFAVLGLVARRSGCRAAARELARLKRFCEESVAPRGPISEQGNAGIE